MERRIMVSAGLGHGMTHGLELAFAALLTYVGAEFGVSLATLGTVVTIGTFTFGATALPAGLLTDRFGPRAVISVTLAIAAVCSFLVALSPNLVVLAIALSVLGAAIGFYHPAGTAMVSTIRGRRGMAFAVHGIAGNLGVALAPALATGIAILVDWRAAYVVFGLMALGVALLVSRIAPSRDEARAAAKLAAEELPGGRPRTTPPSERSWTARPLLLVMGVSVGMGFIYRGALTFMPTHIETNLGLHIFGWSPEAMAGALTTIVLLFALGGQVLGGVLSDRMPVERAIVPIMLLTGPFLALAGMASGALLLVALAGFVVVNFAQQPTVNGLIADYAPQGSRGTAFGISFFLTFGVGSIAGSIAGYVADRGGTDATFALLAGVGGVLAVLSLLIATGAGRRRAVLVREERAAGPVPAGGD